MTEATRTASAEPLPAPAPRPPDRRVPPLRWVRENLLSTWYNTLLTLALLPALAWIVYRLARFVFADARWEIIQRNLGLLLAFRFPEGERWRLWAVLFAAAAVAGTTSALARKAHAVRVADGRARPLPKLLTWRRIGPALALVVVLLLLAGSATALLLTAGVAVVAVAFRLLGRQIPLRHRRLVTVAALLSPAAAFAFITGFGGVGWGRWGGFLLTVGLAVGGIVLSFPFGVLLALGRRSSLPAIRWVCIGYIELIRGVPLITLLFMGAFVIGFVLPPGVGTPESQTRALIAIVLFTAAYVAEIVRGGIQSVPKGHVEAAYALGLSVFATTRLVVLPQALRAVIPALVGQFISLFKDTSLVFIIGLTELLGVANNITKQSDFVAQGLIVETLVFASLVYWVGAYSMSKESQRLERRLGVGER